jgi:subtilisin family serine protease
LRRGQRQRGLSAAIPDRRIPPLSRFSELSSPRLQGKAVLLPQANTLAHLSYQQRRFGRLVSEAGETSLFNPQTILVKFQGARHVSALRVEPMREWEAVRILKRRPDVEFAELDVFQRRQFSPNDPQLSGQWHHTVIGSPQAWDKGLGQSFVRIAIVDSPFQMDHPDLAPNTVSGWDAVANVPVTSSRGIVHSTMCAGMAAAVVNNARGVAGAANCAILPININGAISEMYNATIWAADHGVRVVNLSWTGGNSDTVEAAAAYLKATSRGILAMAGVNGSGFLNYTNQPDIYCISMTDAADNLQSMYGPHIDFAAPGWQILSTTTEGGYATGTGTSYSTPLFCGVVAWLFSLNPTLGPDDVIGILEHTSLDLGPPGWDQYFGWGRVRFNEAAIAAAATLPAISAFAVSINSVMVSTTYRPGLKYNLWRTDTLAPSGWSSVTKVAVTTNGTAIVFTDLSPTNPQAFYRIEASVP